MELKNRKIETMNKTTAIYGILGILIVILVFLIWLFQRPKSNTLIKPNTSTISPSISDTETSQHPTQRVSSIAPTQIPPQFTGALDVTIPQPTIDASNQKQDLRRKTPYQSDAFDITFDYANDLFVVTLQDPKNSNRINFDAWVKQNYPLIPISNFTFK